jgi:hypothetical protein
MVPAVARIRESPLWSVWGAIQLTSAVRDSRVTFSMVHTQLKPIKEFAPDPAGFLEVVLGVRSTCVGPTYLLSRFGGGPPLRPRGGGDRAILEHYTAGGTADACAPSARNWACCPRRRRAQNPMKSNRDMASQTPPANLVLGAVVSVRDSVMEVRFDKRLPAICSVLRTGQRAADRDRGSRDVYFATSSSVFFASFSTIDRAIILRARRP